MSWCCCSPFQSLQALLRWLDGLTEELEAGDAMVIENELQQTVETALRMQAKNSTSRMPAQQRDPDQRRGRHRQQ